ncbi:MAG: hypothetical protein RIB98_09715 [Acidimicrobiales bacterium]
MPAPSPPPVSRRAALKVGSGGALALVLGGGAGWLDRRGGSTSEPSLAIDALTPATSLPATPTTAPTSTAPVAVPGVGAVDGSIVALGERVVAVTGERDVATLLALLPSGSADSNSVGAGRVDPLERAAARVRDDFLAGDTIVVDGWVLAASEARAAAVLHLLCTGEGADAC